MQHGPDWEAQRLHSVHQPWEPKPTDIRHRSSRRQYSEHERSDVAGAVTTPSDLFFHDHSWAELWTNTVTKNDSQVLQQCWATCVGDSFSKEREERESTKWPINHKVVSSWTDRLTATARLQGQRPIPSDPQQPGNGNLDPTSRELTKDPPYYPRPFKFLPHTVIVFAFYLST